MGKRPCCSKVGLNKGAWSKLEDKILTDYIKVHGEGSWNNLPNLAGLKRCGKSCRLRWLNYLRPDVKRGNISQDEEDLIMRMHKLIGNRWSLIAGRLPGRTDNEIKNYWNTSLRKKLEPPSSKVANINRKFNKEKRPKQALEPKNSVDSSHSHVPVEAIRAKAFRITSKTQTVVTTPTKCQYPSNVAGEEKDSNGEMMLNRHLVVDHGYLTPEAADLMINYCDDPKMNDSTCGTSGDHVSSLPIFSEQELEYWFNSSSSNIFNECTTSTFKGVLGDLDFGHLATVLDSDGMKKEN